MAQTRPKDTDAVVATSGSPPTVKDGLLSYEPPIAVESDHDGKVVRLRPCSSGVGPWPCPAPWPPWPGGGGAGPWSTCASTAPAEPRSSAPHRIDKCNRRMYLPVFAVGSE